ncbi:hypothetical protein [Nonomuraea sp. NPDC050202]|uniref:hypothetical protein n=1 Tax=Nonomuraea sp. NPDC050202 TaxID=3155035 RepID=UPI0033EC189F
MFRRLPTTDIPARDVRVGHIYMSSSAGKARRPGSPVTRINYLEDGKPTVYIETADKPGWSYCLTHEEPVSILA